MTMTAGTAAPPASLHQSVGPISRSREATDAGQRRPPVAATRPGHPRTPGRNGPGGPVRPSRRSRLNCTVPYDVMVVVNSGIRPRRSTSVTTIDRAGAMTCWAPICPSTGWGARNTLCGSWACLISRSRASTLPEKGFAAVSPGDMVPADRGRHRSRRAAAQPARLHHHVGPQR